MSNSDRMAEDCGEAVESDRSTRRLEFAPQDLATCSVCGRTHRDSYARPSASRRKQLKMRLEQIRTLDDEEDSAEAVREFLRTGGDYACKLIQLWQGPPHRSFRSEQHSNSSHGSMQAPSSSSVPQPNTRPLACPEGVCPYCKHRHEGSSRPMLSKRTAMKEQVSDALQMPEGRERREVLRSLLRSPGGVFVCKLLMSQLGGAELSKVATDHEEDDADHILGTPGAPEPITHGYASSSHVPLPPGEIQRPGPSGRGSTKLSL
eukprot:TRINITY_DN69548_c0_g1_i1.p1 TRINITY_DN69548_c0_g1~~TRINITY_DN69548_c0_g1_i1.p1  ORF type:complete len:262 (-),score=41.34 TRINITY_DN69548_c0_g1_i1:352-1137(-)